MLPLPYSSFQPHNSKSLLHFTARDRMIITHCMFNNYYYANTQTIEEVTAYLKVIDSRVTER